MRLARPPVLNRCSADCERRGDERVSHDLAERGEAGHVPLRHPLPVRRTDAGGEETMQALADQMQLRSQKQSAMPAEPMPRMA